MKILEIWLMKFLPSASHHIYIRFKICIIHFETQIFDSSSIHSRCFPLATTWPLSDSLTL
jgi:hypothetical protein